MVEFLEYQDMLEKNYKNELMAAFKPSKNTNNAGGKEVGNSSTENNRMNLRRVQGIKFNNCYESSDSGSDSGSDDGGSSIGDKSSSARSGSFSPLNLPRSDRSRNLHSVGSGSSSDSSTCTSSDDSGNEHVNDEMKDESEHGSYTNSYVSYASGVTRIAM